MKMNATNVNRHSLLTMDDAQSLAVFPTSPRAACNANIPSCSAKTKPATFPTAQPSETTSVWAAKKDMLWTTRTFAGLLMRTASSSTTCRRSAPSASRGTGWIRITGASIQINTAIISISTDFASIATVSTSSIPTPNASSEIHSASPILMAIAPNAGPITLLTTESALQT